MLRLELDDSQCSQLRQLARQAVGRVSERANFVLLAAQGYSAPAMGDRLGYEAQTVRTWLTAYPQQGCTGLEGCAAGDRPKTGL